MPKTIFISITEAYEFLIANHEKIKSDDQVYQQAMEDWRKYRQDRSRKRATVYARTSYGTFKNTKFYKTTRIFDGTTIIFSFIVSIMVLIYTIYGYIFRLNHPIPGLEKPSVFAFIMLLFPGMIFFVVSFIYLRAYQETSKKSGTGNHKDHLSLIKLNRTSSTEAKYSPRSRMSSSPSS